MEAAWVASRETLGIVQRAWLGRTIPNASKPHPLEAAIHGSNGQHVVMPGTQPGAIEIHVITGSENQCLPNGGVAAPFTDLGQVEKENQGHLDTR